MDKTRDVNWWHSIRWGAENNWYDTLWDLQIYQFNNSRPGAADCPFKLLFRGASGGLYACTSNFRCPAE